MIDLLILLLKPALLYVEGGQRNALTFVAALVAAPLDVLIAHTTWALATGRSRRGEWTISQTLERLCVTPGPDQAFYVELARRINRISPSGRHIKAVA